jgi:prepilin-type N-terminal cleavage/methylation domain-containing protein
VSANLPDFRHRDRGFTLLEILVALMIFAIAFGAIADIFHTGLRQSRTAGTLFDAKALAEQQIARFGSDLPLEPGTFSGVGSAPSGATPLTWIAEISTVEQLGPDSDLALYSIEVRIRDERADRDHFTLRTLKLGLAP